MFLNSALKKILIEAHFFYGKISYISGDIQMFQVLFASGKKIKIWKIFFSHAKRKSKLLETFKSVQDVTIASALK